MPSASSISLDRCGHILVFAADQARAHLDDRHCAAEAPVHLREFEPDIAAADDQQVIGHEVDAHHAGIGEVTYVGEAVDAVHGSAAADIDENLRRFEQALADPHAARTFEARLALDQRDVRRLADPFADVGVRLRDDRILARLDPCHVDPNRPVEYDAEIGGATRDMGGTRARDQRLGGNAADVDAGAADQLALDDRGFAAGIAQPDGQRRAGLPGADDDRIVRLRHRCLLLKLRCCGSASPADAPLATGFRSGNPRQAPARPNHAIARQRCDARPIAVPTAATARRRK